jgi:hypothetical protein
VNDHIGQIFELGFNDYGELKYIYIKFPKPYNYSQVFKFYYVIDFSSNKENMEIALSTNKYNI